MPTHHLIVQIGAVLLTGLFLISCGTPKQPPIEKIANAELAISLAQDHSANEFAPLLLRYAQDKLALAKDAQQVGAFTKAERLAAEALVDAKLAESKAKAENMHRQTEALRENVEGLRQEIERK